MTTNSENKTIKIFKLLDNSEISKEDLLSRLKIEQSTFYKHLKIIKKSGFEIQNKKGIYQIINYKNILKYSNCEHSIFAYLYLLAKNVLPEHKSKKIKEAFMKMIYFSNEESQQAIIEKYNTYQSLFAKNAIFANYKKETVSKIDNIQENETIFELYDKLVKSYRLKEDERIIDSLENKLVIASSNPNKDELFRRLLRYDILCKVIFPKQHVQLFKKIIQKSLANLDKFQDNRIKL